MLGKWPPLLEKPKVEFLEQERRENFTQHHVKVQVAPGGQQSDGYLLLPDGKGPFPAVLVVYYEAKTPIGRGETGEGSRDFGLQLARRGFVTLSIGTPSSLNEGKDTREALVQSGSEYPLQPLSYLAYAAATRAGSAAGSGPAADRHGRPLLRRQMDHVLILPLRQVRLRRLVRSGHRLRRIQQQCELLGALVYRL
jgi:hypothetical protein